MQCLVFNPLSHQLASCALTDFAFWSSEQKAVQKHKINIKINTCSWTNDGQYLALGLGNGVVSIRNKLGEEKGRIERPGGTAIWGLSWSTCQEDQTDTLCVTDWNKTLSFYTLGGKIVGKERNIGFEPLRVCYFPKGEYILIAGLNKACVMYTRDGIKLDMIGDPQKAWVWCCAAHPHGNFVVGLKLACFLFLINYFRRWDVRMGLLLIINSFSILCMDFIKKDTLLGKI